MADSQYPIPTQFAEEIAARQYAQKDENGKATENLEAMFRRVAEHMARAEALDAYKARHGFYPAWYRDFEGRAKHLKDLEWFDKHFVPSAGPEAIDAVMSAEQAFYDLMMRRAFIPGGRVMAGGGTRVAQMQNCFVFSPNGKYIASATEADSMAGIYELAYQLAETTKTGGGCGIDISFIREQGARVDGSAGQASGPVSYLRLLFNPTLRNVKLGGVRRGAGMCVLAIDHPDALDFLTSKDLDREELYGKIEAFNISFLVTDAFYKSVVDGGFHSFVSRKTGEVVAPTPVQGKYHLPGQEPTSTSGNPADLATSKEIPLHVRIPATEAQTGTRWFKVSNYQEEVDSAADYGTDIEFAVPSQWLWDEIAQHAWQTGDPGVLFVDRVNQFNPMRDELGDITCTNPCGEEPLFPGESCCLGSAILPHYVETEVIDRVVQTAEGRTVVTEKRKYFNFAKFGQDVRMMIRFLDNVLSMNVHPLSVTMEACDSLRRVGLGIMGDADTMIAMGFGYASEEAMTLRQTIAMVMREAALQESEYLAEVKGAFPLCEKSSLPRARRNIYLLSIAPTGTISMASDVNSGIEPIFGLLISRRVGTTYVQKLHPTFETYLREQRPDLELDNESLFVVRRVRVGMDAANNPIFADERMPAVMKAIMDNHGSIHGLDEFFTAEEQALWATAHDISPEDHLRVQALWQMELDGADGYAPMAAISKTINLPNSATVEDVKKIYELAFNAGLKGTTMYRDGSRYDQVLTTDSDEASEEPTSKKYPGLHRLVEALLAEDASGAFKGVRFNDEEIELLSNVVLPAMNVCSDFEDTMFGLRSTDEKILDLEEQYQELTGAVLLRSEELNALLDDILNAAEKIADENEQLREVVQSGAHYRAHRGVETQGRMHKAEFTNGSKSRKVYTYVGLNEDKYPVEVFVNDNKAGRDMAVYANTMGILISLALKYEVPVEEIIEQLLGLQGDSTSFTGGMYQSVPDLVAKLLKGALYDYREAAEAETAVALAELRELGGQLLEEVNGEAPTVTENTGPSNHATVEFATGLLNAPRVHYGSGTAVRADELEVRQSLTVAPSSTRKYKVCPDCGELAVPDEGRTCPPCENCGSSKCG